MGFWFESLLGLCILSLSNTHYTLLNTGSTQEVPKPYWKIADCDKYRCKNGGHVIQTSLKCRGLLLGIICTFNNLHHICHFYPNWKWPLIIYQETLGPNTEITKKTWSHLGGRGVHWYFHTFVGSDHFGVCNFFNFNIFLGFQINAYFWGMKILWIFLRCHHKLD